ncbi:protein SPMIP1 [Megalopta genalis]|uniref:protein SPMIP1 n=1 Tax=Megalopta genalis TaxID=115081 RepID=UPI0014436D7F|nr:protein ATP6V1FNB-like [Megalopta genalis]
MANKGICDARCQAFHVAMIQREEAGRIRWFLKNQQKLLDRLKITEPVKAVELSTPEPEKQSSTIHLKPLPNWRPDKSDGSVDMNIMKPIDPQVRATLYEGAPSFITAENYLNKRLKDMPEERFYYPDCTNWLYGWRLSDYPPVPRSKVGHTNVMIREFYHAKMSSLRKDPEWYRPCLRTPTKCNS